MIVDKSKDWYKRRFGWIPKPVRQVIVLVIGGTLLVLAVVGMILPIMPGVIFIPVALGVMALEFAWAGLWLKKAKAGASSMNQRVRRGLGMKPPAPTTNGAAATDASTSKD